MSDPDPLLAKLDNLMSGKVGAPPKDQSEIDGIYKEGGARYEKRIPPGYVDSDKELSYYAYGGIVYQRLYGDLLIWKQLLAEAKARKLKYVVFLTDDVKEDWWLIIHDKRVGPRPELRDEIYRESGVSCFHIYTSEQFLRFSPEYLGVKVSKDSVRAAGDLLELSFLPERRSFPEMTVENIMSNLASVLINEDDKVTGAMAETNALGYGLDDYEITSAEYNSNTDRIEFTAWLELTGEQDEDKSFCGETIYVDLSGILVHKNGDWEIEQYEIKSCEIADY